MKKLPLALAAVVAALGVGALLRAREETPAIPRSGKPRDAETAAPPRVEAPKARSAPAEPDAVDRLIAARKDRAWGRLARLKSGCASLTRAQIAGLLADPRILEVAELLELASPDAELCAELLRRLRTLDFDSLGAHERGLWLRLVVRFGGSDVAVRFLRDDPRRESKRDAALALAAYGTVAPEVQGGLSGVFAILALDGMRRRGVLEVPRAEHARILEREIELADDVTSREALEVLAAIRGADQSAVLTELAARPDASPGLRRRALALWAEHGMPEDLEKLPSAPPGLEAEYAQARRAIEGRGRRETEH